AAQARRETQETERHQAPATDQATEEFFQPPVEAGNLYDFGEGGGVYSTGHVGESGGFVGTAGREPTAKPLYEPGSPTERRLPGEPTGGDTGEHQGDEPPGIEPGDFNPSLWDAATKIAQDFAQDEAG